MPMDVVNRAPLPRSAKEPKAFVRAKIKLLQAKMTNFFNRNLPTKFDLPKLPSDLTAHGVFYFLSGRDLANALSTSEKIRYLIAQNQGFRQLVENAKLSHLLLMLKRAEYV